MKLAPCQCPCLPVNPGRAQLIGSPQPCANTATAEDMLCEACREARATARDDPGALVVHLHNASVGIVGEDGTRRQIGFSTMTTVYRPQDAVTKAGL